jgi:hypothetical protein
VTQRPLHLVNSGLVLTDDALPETAVDLALSATRITDRYGAAAGARYRHFIFVALAAAPGAGRDASLTLAALAAWRSGALAFRTDALRRLNADLASGGVPPAALAAALGLEPDDLAAFAELQRDSRFGWPALAEPGALLAVVGGFRGLFGPWQAPPMAALAGDSPGTFVLRTGVDARSAEHWYLAVDVFGHTLVRLADEPGEPGTGAVTAERWAAAGETTSAPDEAGAPGAMLRIHAYTAQVRLSGAPG